MHSQNQFSNNRSGEKKACKSYAKEKIPEYGTIH